MGKDEMYNVKCFFVVEGILKAWPTTMLPFLYASREELDKDPERREERKKV